MVYQIRNAVIGYPGNRLLDRVTMEIKNTEKIAIVGRNGCGKTTLLKVIAGILEVDNLDSDEEFLIQADGNPKIGYLKQISFENETNTVKEELLKVFEDIFALQDKMNELTSRMEREASEELLNQYSFVYERFECLGGYSYQYEMEEIFTKFGFEIADLQREIQTFSGGQKTRIAFVKLLLSKPDLLLLDEPTNHLDIPTIEWLEHYLKAYSHAVIIVSHDRMFLDRIVDVTYEIEHKKMKRYSGNYTTFLQCKQLDYEKQCKDYEAQQKDIERLKTFIEKWKNTPTKVAMTRSKQKQIDHMIKIPKPKRFDTREMHGMIQPNKISAEETLTVKELEIGYENRLATVSFDLKRGQKLAVIGENGKGKSTLLKTIVGQINALNGKSRFGREVEWAYFDQELLHLDMEKTVIEEFWDAYPNLKQTEVRTLLGNFLFMGEDVYRPLRQLSGGEKVRLSLAKLMKRQANLLILDEPTNHLDMIGKEALETMLKNYEGTILFVSHDRYFVKRIANCLLVFEGDKTKYVPYDYETYQEKKMKNLVDCDSSLLNISGNSKSDENASKEQIKGEEKRFGSYRGNEKGKKERKLSYLETQIIKQEEKIKEMKEQYTSPYIATDYQKLNEIQEHIGNEERILNELLFEWSNLVS